MIIVPIEKKYYKKWDDYMKKHLLNRKKKLISEKLKYNNIANIINETIFVYDKINDNKNLNDLSSKLKEYGYKPYSNIEEEVNYHKNWIFLCAIDEKENLVGLICGGLFEKEFLGDIIFANKKMKNDLITALHKFLKNNNCSIDINKIKYYFEEYSK